MSDGAIAQVERLQAIAALGDPVKLVTQHVLHAGLYSRTIRIPADVFIVGVRIKRTTVVIVQGDALVWLDDDAVRITGYAVLPAAAGRKQVFRALTETHVTMLFATSAATVEEAEREFTDEIEDLLSRRDDADNEIIITGA